MKRLKLLSAVLMCFGFSLVYAAAQTQPAAGPPAAAPATNPLPAKVAAVAPVAAAPLPDPQTPQEFFARARQLSDLEASGIPFHLKATYVASGDTEFTGNGTYEEWWQSKDLWRKEATLGDYKYVETQYGGKNSAFGSSDYVPLRLRQMAEAVLIRITPGSGSSIDWKLKHQQLNGVDLEELSVDRPCGTMVKCVAGDYFTPQGLLRIHVGDSVQKLYNEFHGFHEVSIPHSIEMAGLAGEILTISIAPLEPLTSADSQLLQNLVPPSNLRAIPSFPSRKILESAQVSTARIRSKTEPIYPPAAKQKRTEGTVVIEATIDAEGNVREPFVINSAGPLLDVAAMDAVKKWRYQPLTIDGVPTCLMTSISVVFRMRP